MLLRRKQGPGKFAAVTKAVQPSVPSQRAWHSSSVANGFSGAMPSCPLTGKPPLPVKQFQPSIFCQFPGAGAGGTGAGGAGAGPGAGPGAGEAPSVTSAQLVQTCCAWSSVSQ